MLDAVYMTVITVTTVGYGETHPLSPAGRLFTIGLIGGGVVIALYALGIFAEVLSSGELAAYRKGRRMDQRLSALRDHFILCGYGRAGTHIAAAFDAERTPYLVIDRNPHIVARLEQEGRLCIEGDATSEDILRAAGIERARGLLSAIDSDEGAVYITLVARALNPRIYILTRASRPEAIRRLKLAGANRALSPYEMVGRYLAELALHPDLVDMTPPLRRGASETSVEEILLQAGSHVLGRTMSDAGLRDSAGARILAVLRSDGSVVVAPDDALLLREGDVVVALGTADELSRTASALQ